ncbi:hypothetical protein LTR78_009720 [Recurvomyces mirabilis]|uniref:Uncharacterized protein n=1 Tax=Recurvomyces mirabilis TaxID=574656 RepID=A0AAE0TND0_9PEZI|nr:hypothetical protein LTR78_009720 [Recurvomyces mirabilis]
MRIFLLPISTRRTLIYCERIQESLQKPGQKLAISERILNRVSTTWAGWEKAEKGWQKKTTVYANYLFSRIPYEEWGLKSFPPATKKKLEEVDAGKHEVECLYPGAFVKGGRVSELLKKLATERQAFHRRAFWTNVALMPISAPFTLVPIRLMDELYAAGLRHPTREASRDATKPSDEEIEVVVKDVETKAGPEGSEGKEIMLLQRWNGKLIAEDFKLAEMEIEIERAVEQVEKVVFSEKKKLEEGQVEERSVSDAASEETKTNTAESEIRRAKR